MGFSKITDIQLENRGILGLPDTPQFTSGEMKRKFDELPREVIIPAFNSNVESLLLESAADEIGAAPPLGITPEPQPETGKPAKLSAVLKGIVTYVSAFVTGLCYSKAETNAEINKKIVEIGAGDMVKAIYDKSNSGAVDNAERLGNELPEYFQPKTDSTLATENKTVVGAINGIIDGTYTVGNASMLGNVVSSEYLKMQKTTTLNVSLSGSDTLGDGSEAKPYKTIQKAVDSLSKYLIGDVEIKVADGVYNENVSVNGFVGIGALKIKSTAAGSVNPNDYDRCKLKWLHVISCSARIEVLGFTLTTLNSTGWLGSFATILNCQDVGLRIKAVVTTTDLGESISAVNIQKSGVVFFSGNLIQNQKRGIFANQNSRVYIQNAVVNNCTFALYSEASIISIAWDSQITGTLAKGDGGLITYGGGQFK